MMKEPAVEVKATHNPLAPVREKRTYVFACTSDLVQQWFGSNRKALLTLDAALEKLGYEEATSPALATTTIVVELGFGTRPVLEQNENSDSIRFQNVAALAGQGRYSQILTERSESSGSLLVGPNGQIIATGGWKRLMDDSERKESKVVGTHDSLILRAWDVAESESAKIFAWEVVVRRAVDYRTPSPEHVGVMIQHAADRLNAGWPTVNSAAPGASPGPAEENPSAPTNRTTAISPGGTPPP